MYQASEEKRQNFKEEDFCADVFLCAFLYNDYQFEEIMESVYSEEEKHMTSLHFQILHI